MKPTRIRQEDIGEMYHFGVVRDWVIKLKSGTEIEIGADVIRRIVDHEAKELGYRLIDLDKLKVLGDEEIKTQGCWKRYPNMQTSVFGSRVAQAMLDDIKRQLSSQ